MNGLKMKSIRYATYLAIALHFIRLSIRRMSTRIMRIPRIFQETPDTEHYINTCYSAKVVMFYKLNIAPQFLLALECYTIENNEALKASEMDMDTMQDILDLFFAPNASVVNFTPVELSMRGLPYLESGDYIELTAEDGETVETYILSQTISGIQHLTAEVTSTNGALLEVIDDE